MTTASWEGLRRLWSSGWMEERDVTETRCRACRRNDCVGTHEKTHFKRNVFGEAVVLGVVEREDVDKPQENRNDGPLRTRLERLQERAPLGRRQIGRGVDHEGTNRVLPPRVPRIQLEGERRVEVEKEETEEIACVFYFLRGRRERKRLG